MKPTPTQGQQQLGVEESLTKAEREKNILLETLKAALERIEELEQWIKGAIPWVEERDIKSYGKKLLKKSRR